MKAPSQHQLTILAKMRETGQPLVRWPGGFWTYKGCPADPAPRSTAPAWWVTNGIQSIRSMERLGLLRRTNVHPEEWRDERALTE